MQGAGGKVITSEVTSVRSTPSVPSVTVAADYRAQVERLNEALADPEARLEAIPALRELIDRIVLTPNPNGSGVLLEVEGRLAAIFDLASGKSALEERLFVMERVKGIEPSS